MFVKSKSHINPRFNAQTVTLVSREIPKAKKVGGRKGQEMREAAWFVGKGTSPKSKATHKVVESVTVAGQKPKARLVYTGTDYKEAAAAFGHLKGYTKTTYYNNRKSFVGTNGQTRKGAGWTSTEYRANGSASAKPAARRPRRAKKA